MLAGERKENSCRNNRIFPSNLNSSEKSEFYTDFKSRHILHIFFLFSSRNRSTVMYVYDRFSWFTVCIRVSECMCSLNCIWNFVLFYFKFIILLFISFNKNSFVSKSCECLWVSWHLVCRFVTESYPMKRD